MTDIISELAHYTPYVFLVAIVVFLAYIWVNRRSSRASTQ